LANLTLKMGNCNHRKYVPSLLSKIASGRADPTTVWMQQEVIPTALRAYEAFDRRDPGWTKVTLEFGSHPDCRLAGFAVRSGPAAAISPLIRAQPDDRQQAGQRVNAAEGAEFAGDVVLVRGPRPMSAETDLLPTWMSGVC
jgi:hypothetical protein